MTRSFYSRANRALCIGALALLTLSGCISNKGPTESAKRFDLGIDQAPVASSTSARGPINLSLDAAALASENGMLWRVADSASPQAYANSRWAAPPEQLVRQRLVERLSRNGPLVTQTVAANLPQLRLTLTQFEQVFAVDGASSVGLISLQATLVQDRKVVAATRIDRRSPAPSNDAAGGVAALIQATADASDALGQWLDTVMIR